MLEKKDFRELTLTALTLTQNNSCKTTCMEHPELFFVFVFLINNNSNNNNIFFKRPFTKLKQVGRK